MDVVYIDEGMLCGYVDMCMEICACVDMWKCVCVEMWRGVVWIFP